MEPNTMNCAVPTANTIAQCAGTVNVGELTTGSTYVLRVVNVASSKTEYVVGNTDEIVIAGFDFSPGSVYALSLTNGTFKPYIDESTVGTTEVEMIYVKVDKVFNPDGTIYAPAEQWIILPQ